MGGSHELRSARRALPRSTQAALDLGGFAQTVSSLSGNGTVTNSAPSGATLTVNDTVSTTFAGVIQDGLPPMGGQTSLAVQGPGALILTGANTYTGGTTISAAIPFETSGGTLQIGNGGTSGSIVGNVTNNGALVFDRSDTITFGGAISGTGSVTQQARAS